MHAVLYMLHSSTVYNKVQITMVSCNLPRFLFLSTGFSGGFIIISMSPGAIMSGGASGNSGRTD